MKYRRSLLLLLICLLAGGLSQSTIGQAEGEDEQSRETIRVGWYTKDNTGAKADHQDGHGYDYEYLQALAQYTDWKYEYVVGTWEECVGWLESGEIDTMGFVSKSEERETLFNFPELPMAVTSGQLVVSSENDKIKQGDKKQLQGITVGIVRENLFNQDFDRYQIENNLNVSYKEFTSMREIEPALLNGVIDAAVVAEEDKTPNEKVVSTICTGNEYFAVTKKKPELLNEMNDAMMKVSSYCPYLQNDLYQKYINRNVEGKPDFTDAELQFIQEHPNILVMYDSGWPPVEYWDEEKNRYVGISPDLFDLLSEKCGLKFVYEGTTSGQVLADLQNDTNKNVITTISYDYEWADKNKVQITQPFVTSTVVKLGRNLNQKDAVAAINEKAYFTFLLQDMIKDIKTKNYAKQAERLEAVRKRDVDYTFVTEDQANYYRSIPKYSNLKVEKMPDYVQKICISVTKSSDPELLAIMSKSLGSITHDEMAAIVMKNTTQGAKLTFTDQLYRYRVLFIAGLCLLLAIVASVVAALRISKAKRVASEQIGKTKAEFLSHVSHDIRTPLNAVIGITTLAMEEKNPEIVRDYMGKINESGKYLLGLINDTLDMSKIESGKMRLEEEAVSYDEVYSMISAIIAPKAEEKDITLSFTQKGVIDRSVQMDKLRFEQIFLNLLNNAVKFTPRGGEITCNTEMTGHEGDMVHFKISISDNGVGMSEEYMKKLFTPFEQERNRLSVENAGTGLGLSIVKSLVDMMGGTITCKSKKNEGTCFEVALTFRLSTEAEIEAKRKTLPMVVNAEFGGKRILLAEDNRLNTLVASKVLEKKGMQVTSVLNGKEAVECFVASEEGYFDLILMDIHMPIMDGYEASKAIRALNRKDVENLPIVALSANAFDEDRKECLEAGMNDHVAKPVEPELLYETISKYL